MKISILTVPSKKERHASSVSFFFGFAGRCPLHPPVLLLSNGAPLCWAAFYTAGEGFSSLGEKTRIRYRSSRK